MHITFFLFFFPPLSHVVLGYPWFECHNPHINWSTRHIESWSSPFLSHCLQSALPPPPVLSSKLAPENLDLLSVPEVIWGLFSVNTTLSHFPLTVDMTVPLNCYLETSCLPVGLSGPEKAVMDRYITESRLIRLSSLPLVAVFFFVGKKDQSLRLCIDYQGLNDITVKNKYPLPLISSAIEPLQEAIIFTKLDIRNAYHLVRMRQADE